MTITECVWKENFNFILQAFIYKIHFLDSIKYLGRCLRMIIFKKYANIFSCGVEK